MATATGELSGLSFDHAIPRDVRNYGRAIDPRILEPGDLILVSKAKKSWVSRTIHNNQLKMFPEEHARWHHAAVSGGRFEICEATVSGVKAQEYWAYMNGDYDIRIRRLRDANEAARGRIAYYAAINVGVRYGFGTILKARKSLSTGESWRRVVWWSKGVICSQLYFEACMRIGFLLNNIPPETVCPAHLSQSSLLEDVPIEWVKV